MSYPKSNGPYTLEFGGYMDSTPVVFNLTETTRGGVPGVLLSWENTPFDAAGTRPATMVAVGKEYGTLTNKYQTTYAGMYASVVECPTQGLNCIKGMIGDTCESGIWDTPIAGVNGMLTVPYTPLWEIFVPFNDFWVQSCAFQTDGVSKQYYVELTSVGGNILKTKWVFDYTTPVAPFNACGAIPVEPPTTPAAPPSGTAPAEPTKGHGNSGNQGGGKPPKN